jgi:hypothetical protein
MQRLIVECE